MLTHMHMVVYTWWCWHFCKGGGVPRVERGVAFEKIKCIFSIAPVGNLEKLRECFLAAPDACWSRASGVVSLAQVCRAHRTLGGYCSSVRWCVTSASAREEFLTGEHRTLRVRPVACVW